MERTTTSKVALYAVMTIALMCGFAPQNTAAIQTLPTTVDFLTQYMDQQIVTESQKYRDRQIECLAKNIYFEARGEPHKGQVAVGLVTINRTKVEIFPDDICGVVHQGIHDKKGRPVRHQCQFSWYCDGRKRSIQDQETYSQIQALSTRLYDDYFVANNYTDTSKGALYFHSKSVDAPMKGKYITTRIGDHIFYRMAKT